MIGRFTERVNMISRFTEVKERLVPRVSEDDWFG